LEHKGAEPRSRTAIGGAARFPRPSGGASDDIGCSHVSAPGGVCRRQVARMPDTVTTSAKRCRQVEATNEFGKASRAEEIARVNNCGGRTMRRKPGGPGDLSGAAARDFRMRGKKESGMRRRRQRRKKGPVWGNSAARVENRLRPLWPSVTSRRRHPHERFDP